MLTGKLKSQVDRIWEAFWSGGISNGLTVIEQITYLLFARRLDELHTAREAQANLLKKPIENSVFKRNQQKLRWSRFKDLEPEEMYRVFRDEVFPFIKALNGTGSAYARFMKDAVFVIPTPALLDRVVGMLERDPHGGP